MNKEDRDLGMDREISRRDFVQGVAVAAGTSALVIQTPAFALDQMTDAANAMTEANYPPLRHGLRGNHPGSFNTAHAERDGQKFGAPEDTGETYDLVVVGGGASGFAAAYFYRQRAGKSARILVIDNHDDFGGHAKRNEYVYQGSKFIIPGGSDFLDGMPEWTYEAQNLIRELGVDIRDPADHVHFEVYKSHGMGPATFFRKEVYGRDQLIVGTTPQQPTPEFLAMAPLPDAVKTDLLRLMSDTNIDYLSGLSPEAKVARLRTMSYRDYLLKVAKVHPDVLPYTNGVWCLSNDLSSAWFAFFRGKPGFAGLGLVRPFESPESPRRRAQNYTLPAGNSDVVRLMVRALIPEALLSGSLVEVETARVNYAVLDQPSNTTRVRLNSTVTNVRHTDAVLRKFDPDTREVEVTYQSGGKGYLVRAKDVVMAGNNNYIPYICPELPDEQKAALHKAVRAVNQQTNALFRNWEAFAKLKIDSIACPRSFYEAISLQTPRSFGDLKASMDPSDPVLVSFGGASGILAHETMVRELLGGKDPVIGSSKNDQFRAVRAGLLRTPFEHFERALRSQIAGALAGSDFDPARDIIAITVNRWGHGFATGRDELFDDESLPAPSAIARKKFGHIAIANCDASGMGTFHTAIDEAFRAVRELEPRRYGFFESF